MHCCLDADMPNLNYCSYYSCYCCTSNTVTHNILILSFKYISPHAGISSYVRRGLNSEWLTPEWVLVLVLVVLVVVLVVLAVVSSL